MSRLGKIIENIEDALKQVRPGERLFVGSGSSAPQGILSVVGKNPKWFTDSEITHISTTGPAPYCEPEFKNHLRHNALFIGGNTRRAVWKGDADYTPIFLSEIPRLFKRKRVAIDICLIQVAKGVNDNMFSLGANVDVVRAAMEHARIVIAQVNKEHPYTFGQSELYQDEIDYLWFHDNALPEHIVGPLGDVENAIGRNTASLISDGSTIQLGIGKIPDAVTKALHHKKDLGVHTEMFSDGMVDLIKSGAVTGRKKSSDVGLHVTSFVIGTKKVYDFVHNNPQVRFYTSDITNDPSKISMHHKMTSINSALEVDLTGQVVADSIGNKMYSGIGGQVDYTRGAARCEEGLPVIALPSTAKNGTLSRIKCLLTPGAGVVTSRGDVHYVVTEYGIADLYGRTVEERALSLIEIAHPKFRAELLTDAKSQGWIHEDVLEFEPDCFTDQNWMSEIKLTDGQELWHRPIKPSDERAIQDFFYKHSTDSIYRRYGYHKKTLNHGEMVQRMRNTDEQAVFAAVGGAVCGRTIRGIGRFAITPGISDSNQRLGEVGVIVSDEYQGKGLGKKMLQKMESFARSRGLDGFVFIILKTNTSMRRLVESMYPTSTVSYEEDQIFCEVLFANFSFHE